jgi:cysteinyl-tRNA synthetase
MEGYVGRCEPCNKKAYSTRAYAKKAVKRWHPGEHVSAYPCPVTPNLFHVGHLSKGVISGVTSRTNAYPAAA